MLKRISYLKKVLFFVSALVLFSSKLVYENFTSEVDLMLSS